jgi:hypothetical protein
MMGPKQEAQAALFYEFSLEDHVPQDHLLRSIDRFVDLSDIRQYLSEFYSHTGRPSIDPELLIRMLLVGYCFGIRSERRLALTLGGKDDRLRRADVLRMAATAGIPARAADAAIDKLTGGGRRARSDHRAGCSEACNGDHGQGRADAGVVPRAACGLALSRFHAV